jgi:hypothetical protein
MSVKRINLLPQEQLRQLRLRGWYRILLRFYVFAGASFLVVALLYAGVWWYLGAAERGLSAEAESLRAQSNSETTILPHTTRPQQENLRPQTHKNAKESYTNLVIEAVGAVPGAVNLFV